MIKNRLVELTRQAILAAQQAGDLPRFDLPEVMVERSQRPELGEFSSPVAMKLAGLARRSPLQIASSIASHLPVEPALAGAETAPPGFVNFRLSPVWLAAQVEVIEKAGESFGNVELGAGKVQVEHVSANPTGPLHVGSARNGAIGDTLARVLRAAGYRVATEYYINDAGSQVRHFGESIYARYLQATGRDEPFPEDGYKGAYVSEIANAVLAREGTRYLNMERDEAARALGRLGIDMMLADARVTLSRMGVEYDEWFSERSLYDSGLFEKALQILRDKGLVYESDGAVWFAATRLGIEKDAVLIRSPAVIAEPNERPTYLASDVAYVWNKLVERGFDRAIYVWGAGQHGDVPRVLAAARALGLDDSRVTIVLYQNVQLTRAGQAVTMSKRAGEFTRLSELLDEIGSDAVRFMLITRSADSPMDFDLQLAKEQSDENPVYYVQYAHARIASILRHAADLDLTGEGGDLTLLQHPAELELIRMMLRLEEIVELAALRLEPHHLPHYAMELAATFHSFYRECRVVSSNPEDANISKARLRLVHATKNVLARTLGLMGVAAPESM